jgi:arylsulfatase B
MARNTFMRSIFIITLTLTFVTLWLSAFDAVQSQTLGDGLVPVPSPKVRNIVLILADDMGVDMLKVYNEGTDFPQTPTIDRLRAEGVLFRNVWSYPNCSPTRATILTGRYGFRTGIMDIIGSDSLVALLLDELTIPEILDLNPQAQHTHAAIGKWHLGNCLNGDRDSPNLSGFSHYAGSLANVSSSDQSFFHWDKTVNGKTSRVHVYATTDNVNDAIHWIQNQTGPWFLYLPFNAPHRPWEVPPHHLVSPTTLERLKDTDGLLLPAGTLCTDDNKTLRACYVAMIEAMDHEIGRLLNTLPPEVRAQTSVIFLGDNGTPGETTVLPFQRNQAKSSLFEGGINVPLIISGAGVVNPNRESTALVNTTDMFATILELATGQDILELVPLDIPLDSISLVPILNNIDLEHRGFIYSELFSPTRLKLQSRFGQVIRNKRYKLRRFTMPPQDAFYDLVADPFEQNDLLRGSLDATQQANLDALRQQLASLLAPTAGACPIESLCSDCSECVVGSSDCSAIDTGEQVCQRSDATQLHCLEGQTIHIVRCPCAGPQTCPNRHDQLLVCR